MPIASMALNAPGPASAVIITAVSKEGNAKAKSDPRISNAPTQPPRAAASAPRGMPIPAPSTTATTATSRELRAPPMIIDSTSRPNGSVPSQCPAEGAASLCRMSIAAGG
jgi:hypothetical protein